MTDMPVRDDLYVVSVTVKYGYAGSEKCGWHGELYWQDTRFAEPGTVQGTIVTRYFEATITEAIDHVTGVARQFGLKMDDGPMPTFLHGKRGWIPPGFEYPADMEQQLQAEAERRGWKATGVSEGGEAA